MERGMSLRAVDPAGSNTDPVAFQLDRLRRDGERGLEVRGRWSGVRGRRFVRPTLTLRIDGAKHRLLADLEHKPWAAQEGEEWVARFSPLPPAGKADRFELSVAPDITVALSAPGSRASSAKGKRPAAPAAGAASAPARPATRRASQADRARPAVEADHGKARDLGRELEASAADRARLAAERDKLRLERDALAVERDGMRRQQGRARKKVAELQRELKALEASANAGLSEARETLEAERAETTRLRTVLEAREVEPGEHDRLTRELETLVAERDRLAEHTSQARLARSEAVSVGVPVRRPLPARSARRAPVWVARALVLTAMCAVVLAFAHTLHYL
jgi:hypothetical protein